MAYSPNLKHSSRVGVGVGWSWLELQLLTLKLKLKMFTPVRPKTPASDLNVLYSAEVPWESNWTVVPISSEGLQTWVPRIYKRVEWFFLVWQKTALNQRSGMILEVQIQIFGAWAPAKFLFSKNSRGPKYYYFLVKIGNKLPSKIFTKTTIVCLLFWKLKSRKKFKKKN